VSSDVDAMTRRRHWTPLEYYRFPGYTTDRGLVVAAPDPAQLRTFLSTYLPPRPSEGMNPSAPHAIAVRWEELELLAPVDPFPRLQLVWRWPGGGTDQRLYDPLRGGHAARFAEGVRAVVETALEHAPQRVERGWMSWPTVEPEPVSGPPTPPPERVGRGAYRSHTPAAPERILASRDALSWRERFGSVFHGGMGPLAQRAVLTDVHLYVKRPRRGWARLPLSMLRTVDSDSKVTSFVFGQGTHVRLWKRPGCEVQRQLIEMLRSGEEA
jgi:hypothetical protein